MPSNLSAVVGSAEWTFEPVPATVHAELDKQAEEYQAIAAPHRAIVRDLQALAEAFGAPGPLRSLVRRMQPDTSQGEGVPSWLPSLETLSSQVINWQRFSQTFTPA